MWCRTPDTGALSPLLNQNKCLVTYAKILRGLSREHQAVSVVQHCRVMARERTYPVIGHTTARSSSRETAGRSKQPLVGAERSSTVATGPTSEAPGPANIRALQTGLPRLEGLPLAGRYCLRAGFQFTAGGVPCRHLLLTCVLSERRAVNTLFRAYDNSLQLTSRTCYPQLP